MKKRIMHRQLTKKSPVVAAPPQGTTTIGSQLGSSRMPGCSKAHEPVSLRFTQSWAGRAVRDAHQPVAAEAGNITTWSAGALT